MPAARRCVVLLAVTGALASGCQQPRPIVCDPPLALRMLEPGLTDPAGGYAVLRPEATQGRFPCSLAVARLAPLVRESPLAPEDAGIPSGREVGHAESARHAAGPSPPQAAPDAGPAGPALRNEHRPGAAPATLTIVALAPAEQARWSETFRGCPFISDVRYLSPRSIQPEGQAALGTPADRTAALCAAARRAEAPLLLVYALNREECCSAQSLGVLYEVASGQPLAALRAATAPSDNGCAAGIPACRESSDERAPGCPEHQSCCDPRPAVLRVFEQHALACLRDQVSRDAPADTTQPHRWTPLYPYAIVPVAPPPPGASLAPGSQPASPPPAPRR